MGDVVTDIAERGWAVVPDVLSPGAVERAIDGLGQVFEAETDIAEERGWLTDRYRVSYLLPAKHPAFLGPIVPPQLLAAARAVLGDDCVLAGANGIDMVPGGRGQRLHPDHRTPTPGVTLYLQSVIALDDLTVANGATRVADGTHRRTDLSDDPEIVDELERSAQVVELASGSALVFDASLWHGAGANRTDGPRRALHQFFARPWVQPHWDLPASLPDATIASLTAEERRLLGFARVARRFDLAERRVVVGDQAETSAVDSRSTEATPTAPSKSSAASRTDGGRGESTTNPSST